MLAVGGAEAVLVVVRLVEEPARVERPVVALLELDRVRAGALASSNSLRACSTSPGGCGRSRRSHSSPRRRDLEIVDADAVGVGPVGHGVQSEVPCPCGRDPFQQRMKWPWRQSRSPASRGSSWCRPGRSLTRMLTSPTSRPSPSCSGADDGRPALEAQKSSEQDLAERASGVPAVLPGSTPTRSRQAAEGNGAPSRAIARGRRRCERCRQQPARVLPVRGGALSTRERRRCDRPALCDGSSPCPLLFSSRSAPGCWEVLDVTVLRSWWPPRLPVSLPRRRSWEPLSYRTRCSCRCGGCGSVAARTLGRLQWRDALFLAVLTVLAVCQDRVRRLIPGLVGGGPPSCGGAPSAHRHALVLPCSGRAR